MLFCLLANSFLFFRIKWADKKSRNFMKCPPKVLCLTFGGHFIMTKGSIYFFELPPKIPFLPVWYCFSDEGPHILCSAFPQIQKKIPDSANGRLSFSRYFMILPTVFASSSGGIGLLWTMRWHGSHSQTRFGTLLILSSGSLFLTWWQCFWSMGEKAFPQHLHFPLSLL